MARTSLALLSLVSVTYVARSDWLDNFHSGLRGALDAFSEDAPQSQLRSRKTMGGCDVHSTCQACLGEGEGLFGRQCTWCADDGARFCKGSVDLFHSKCTSDGEIKDESECTPFATTRRPVIIVPGLIGSVVEAKLDKKEVPKALCSKTADWYTLWLSLSEILPEMCTCFLDNIRMRYLGDGNVANNDGVSTRIPFYGDSVKGVSCLSPSACSLTKAFFDQVNALKAVGYVEGEDLFSAPYEWREGPIQYRQKSYVQLKQLIEEVRQTTEKQVVLLGISMAGPYVQSFLANEVTQEWKDQHIDSWISMAGVFNGAQQSLRQLIGGMPLDRLDYLDRYYFRDSLREWPSLAWLVPNEINEFDPIVAYTPSKNYTMSESSSLLEAAGASAAADMKENVYNSQKDATISDPGVKVHCWYSNTIPTDISYIYNNDDVANTEPQVVYGPGDGTVPEGSLQICRDWPRSTVKVYEDVCHTCFLTNPEVIEDIVSLVTKKTIEIDADQENGPTPGALENAATA